MEPAKFVPFQVFIDPAFWAEVSRRRLDEWKLEAPEVKLTASYGIYGKQSNDCTLTIAHDALNPSTHSDRDTYLDGTLLLCNTLKDFTTLDLKKILEQEAEKAWNHAKCPDSLKTPAFTRFYLAAFADLKNYSYYYAVCIPALLFPANIQKDAKAQTVDSKLFELAIKQHKQNPRQPFFIKENQQVEEFSSALKAEKSTTYTLVFANPSTYKNHPGWPLRNLLTSIAYHRPEWTSIKVLALRGSAEDSEAFTITWSPSKNDVQPNAVGWSKPEHVNLKSAFDPIKLMESSVDMNLKLIRWRMVPQLKLQPLSDLKVLIMGAGTLGCNLARLMLGWGIRNFTFVDNSVVSYNNPVRQSLYNFEDCKAAHRQKATAAAEALKLIYPSVNAQGVSMKIPMPGHPISVNEIEKVREDCQTLEELVKSHGVVFLVMDSRESRWLPTLLATRHQTLAITVALGFDSFVVMRHGLPSSNQQASQAPMESSPETIIPGTDLGCYYCSDVTAPGNSIEDRTLDQNCTITRAGISGIASGIATELLASLVQHEQGPLAPALLSSVDESSSVLGATPHQIRGFIKGYHFMTPTVRRFEKCTACGHAVQENLINRGFDFLLSVFQDPNELEKISGLQELQSSVNEINLDLLAATDDDSE
ncbi:Ubiquitin-like modifier-activating enzyme ATG7 [Aphelenchoides bicaudatus]|nr:Ubiquitin-like modifier-activating enzyme ATG7 [Aphelenchoides bicaudatus]